MEQKANVRRHVAVFALLGWALLSCAAQETPARQPGNPSADRSVHRLPPATVERMLIEAVHHTPGSYAANHDLGEFYLHQGKLRAGISYLKRAQEADPHHYDNGYDLALAYLETGQAESTRGQIQSMLKEQETAELHNLLGDADDKLGDYLAAANEYHRASEMDPSQQNIFDLADFLLRHKNYAGFLDRSIVFFRYGLQKYPRSEELTVGLGVALYADENYDEAVQTLCAAVDLNPADKKPFLFLGRVGKVSPRLLPEVRKRLEGFVQLYPRNAAANYFYAMNLWQRSQGQPAADLPKVEQLLKIAESLDPRFYEAHYQMGVLYQGEQRYAEAVKEFKETVALRPDFPKARYRLALMYNRVGEKLLAEQQLAVARRLRKQEEDEDDLDEPPSGSEKP